MTAAAPKARFVTPISTCFVVQPELFRLEAPPKSNIVTPLGITARQRFYSGGADCSGGAEVSSATAFYVRCQARCLRTPCPVNVARDLKNAVSSDLQQNSSTLKLQPRKIDLAARVHMLCTWCGAPGLHLSECCSGSWPLSVSHHHKMDCFQITVHAVLQIVYATSGEAAAPLGGGSTAISTAVFGQITAGSASVVYGLQTRPGGTFVISRPKGDLGTAAFTTAFRIGAGASDIDVF